MGKKTVLSYVSLCLLLCLTACGGGNSPQPAAGTPPSTSEPASAAPAAAPAKSGFHKIGDVLDAWSTLYKDNEAVLNSWEGMPIIELVTPATTFIGSVQYDLLNMDNKDGRFEGTLPLAGYKGTMERAGSKITFGSDRKLEKDGFGPMAKAGDREVENGSLDLGQEWYKAETFTERGGKKISRGYHEFKRLGDGSMICLVYSGHGINARGDAETSDNVIYIHNGKARYDFVVGKGKTGPQFTPASFADKGDLSKEQAIALFKSAGYTIEKTGGVKDGKLVLDK